MSDIQTNDRAEENNQTGQSSNHLNLLELSADTRGLAQASPDDGIDKAIYYSDKIFNLDNNSTANHVLGSVEIVGGVGSIALGGALALVGVGALPIVGGAAALADGVRRWLKDYSSTDKS